MGTTLPTLRWQLAKALQRNPRELAQALVAVLPASPLVDRAEIAGAGFINFFVTPPARQAIVTRVLAERDAFGRSQSHAGERVMVEFVSANPTGPLHVGHGRQAALGDAIASLLESRAMRSPASTTTTTPASRSRTSRCRCSARAQELKGEPRLSRGRLPRRIHPRARAAIPRGGSARSRHATTSTRSVVSRWRSCGKSRIPTSGARRHFDNYYLESSLYTEGRVDATVARLAASGKTYEKDGALWLKTTDYGDDKDRVMRKSDGSYTYFVPDVAYHVTKWERGFVRVDQCAGRGSSQHRHARARRAAGDGNGHSAGYPEYVLHKMVTVMRGGEEVKISKRAGTSVTVRDLIDEVGRDAVRFFLVSRKADSELVFDIDLARSKSEENPVYYVQYAHARVCSVLKQAAMTPDEAVAALADADLSPLTSPYEQALLRRIADFPAELAAAAREARAAPGHLLPQGFGPGIPQLL